MRTTTTHLISFTLAVSLNSVTPFKRYIPINKPAAPPLSEELIKIKKWTCQEHTSLWNNLLECYDARSLDGALFTSAAIAIGLQEMRSSLGFPPPPKWISYNATQRNEDKIPSTLGAQSYYELREPQQSKLHHISETFSQDVDILAVQYLDGRDPVIREIFKNEFNKVRQLDTGLVNREVVDRMIDRFDKIYKKMKEVIDKKSYSAGSYELCKESNHSADHFTFVNNDSLMSNPQKLLETTQPRLLPENLPTINSLLANIPYFTEQEHKMFWKNTFSADEGKKHTSKMVNPVISIIVIEELLSAIGMSELPTLDDGFFSYSASKSGAEESVEQYLAQKASNYQLSDYTKRRDTSLLFKDLLDKRFPEIRMVCKLRFQEMLQMNKGFVDKEVLDRMIDEVYTMKENITKLIMQKEIEKEEQFNEYYSYE